MSNYMPYLYADVIINSCAKLSAALVNHWGLVTSYDGIWFMLHIETVSPGGTFCDTVQVPPGAHDMELI